VLATVLFTDIVGATVLAERLGDRAWADLVARHHGAVGQELARFRGREVDTAGDGSFATFDGPARGVRCALAIRDAVRTLGIEVRAGLHAGECERVGQKVGGIAVHIGARVMGLAGASEVLVSRTVRDLVTGSGLRFEDHGHHRLKGVEGEWALFRVARGLAWPRRPGRAAAGTAPAAEVVMRGRGFRGRRLPSRRSAGAGSSARRRRRRGPCRRPAAPGAAGTAERGVYNGAPSVRRQRGIMELNQTRARLADLVERHAALRGYL
jgi:hypothetical protein